jgi:abhydrolase domain-containing protein 12
LCFFPLNVTLTLLFFFLEANKTYNLHIQTPDNETIGAWFTLSDPFYQALAYPPLSSDSFIEKSLKKHPTILFLHGNAATRAMSKRVQQYQVFSSRLSCNVLAIDYRGFADSSGVPSEAGLIIDTRAAWDWLVNKGAKPKDILIVGHSLGTGVGGGFASVLSREKIEYRGLVLMSPFSSMESVIQTYHVLGLVPLIKPFTIFPFAMSTFVTLRSTGTGSSPITR